MRLSHLFKKETLSIHWSIHLLVCPSIHLCVHWSATTFWKLQNLAKSSEINCKIIVQFNKSNIRKTKKILRRKLHNHSRIVICKNLFFDPCPLFDVLKQGRIHGYLRRVRLGRGSTESLQASKQRNTQSKIRWHRPTDRRTDIVSYRVASTRLKNWATDLRHNLK